MKELTNKKGTDGFYRFYIGDKEVTGEWMMFFSGLNFKDEKDCVKLFKKKYKKLFT